MLLERKGLETRLMSNIRQFVKTRWKRVTTKTSIEKSVRKAHSKLILSEAAHDPSPNVLLRTHLFKTKSFHAIPTEGDECSVRT